MDSRDSWIDPEEVSDLAGEVYPKGKFKKAGTEFKPVSLLDDEDELPPELEEEVAEAVEIEEDDDAFTARRISEHLHEIRERAERSGLLVGSEPQSDVAVEDIEDEGVEALVERFVLPAGRLAEQVAAIGDWLAESGEFDQVMLLDELGDGLLHEEIAPGLRSGAVRLAQSWERSQRWLREEEQAAEAPLAGAALADGKILSVVGVRVAGGFYCAATVGAGMLSVSHAGRVREALILVFG